MRTIDELLSQRSPKKNIDELRKKFFSELLRRPSTRKQARLILEKYGAGKMSEALMREAESRGLVDDEAFARLFVDGHLRWGDLKIAHELRMRGVGREEVAVALKEAESEEKRARELAEGWRESGVEDRKIAARLQGRGFTKMAVRYALSRVDGESMR